MAERFAKLLDLKQFIACCGVIFLLCLSFFLSDYLSACLFVCMTVSICKSLCMSVHVSSCDPL